LPELPAGWCWATIAQVGAAGEQVVLTGPFGSSLGREDFVESGVPLLTIGCLTERGITTDKAFHISPNKAAELERYQIKMGDVLFSRMASVGRADTVSDWLNGAVINYHLMRLRLAINAIEPRFFILFVRGSKSVVDYLGEVNHGATRDGINTEQLMALPVAVPPPSEQRRIIVEVDARLSVLDDVRDALHTNLKRAERLRQSILRRAFEGKLVLQVPGDEPASNLWRGLARARRWT